MKELIVKKWINGHFEEVTRFQLSEVKQIQHLSTGFRLILDGHVRDFDSRQIVLEFK